MDFNAIKAAVAEAAKKADIKEYELYYVSDSGVSAETLKHEISNFSRNKKYSLHNLKYWKREDYLGLGLAAHSCIGIRRFFATCDIEKYLRGERIAGEEVISPHDILCEKIMLGMRLGVGIDFDLLGEEGKIYKKRLENFISSGHIEKNGNSLSFSNEGMYISNYILSEVLDFEN